MFSMSDTEFNILWEQFSNSLPIVKYVLDNSDILKLKKNYIKRLLNIGELKVDESISSCLLDRFVCSYNSNELSAQFQIECACISNAVNKALALSKGNDLIQNKLKDIIKNMIMTIDVNPMSKNNDYRNRLNELLVFNYLSECENIKVLSIEKKLENGRSCDFECSDSNGMILLFEVLSINNLCVDKQDNSSTFSDFISNKIQNKYNEKTKGLIDLPIIYIIPILEYTDGLNAFNIQINEPYSSPPFTVVRNTIGTVRDICLCNLYKISEHIRHQKDDRL